ncbi:MAG TPA: hypothetical protein VM406_05615, partial [Noviherbaspirillum sp.]|nr:hypothetical protein [Noviherbaspirillum sp.]
LLGVYQHFYEDNAFGDSGFGTHYVVIACAAELAAGTTLKADAQHARLQWWDVPALVASSDVHANTKAYFMPARWPAALPADPGRH